MFLKSINLKLRYKLIRHDYHTSIDTLPIYNFIECCEGNLQYLFKGNVDKLPKIFPEKFIKIYEELFFQFDKLNNQNIRMSHRSAMDRAKFLLSGGKDTVAYVRAMDTEVQLKKIMDNEDIINLKANFNEEWIELKRFMYGQLDIYITSTREYYNIRENYIKNKPQE